MILSNTPTMKAPAQSSRAQNTAVGGSASSTFAHTQTAYPKKSSIAIPTSAPMDPLTQGRSTPDALK